MRLIIHNHSPPSPGFRPGAIRELPEALHRDLDARIEVRA
jgi:hypothetical protein